jgi:hypothetical protein
VIGPGFADLPDGGRSSRWGRRPEIQNGTVLYSASGDNTSAFGVFSWTPNGGGRTVVDASTPNPVNPGRPLFPYSLYPVLHDGLVGVVSFGNPGIFVADPDGHIVQTVATDTTMAPGGSVNFTTFGSAPIDLGQGSVLFEGRSGVTDGLYTTLGGALRLVASTNTPIPGGQGNFMPFDTTTTEFALSSAGVVFTGMGSGTQRGIYGDFSGALVRVLAVGDTLDGRLVSDVFVGRDGLVGDRLVFTVFFTDDQSAVYIVTVPAPSAAFAVGGLGVWCTRRRRAVA